MAYALASPPYNSPPVEQDLFAMFFPIFVVSMIFGILCYILAKRKVDRVGLYTFLAFIPVIGWIFVYPYLVSLTDKEIFDRLERIENLLKNR